MMMDNFSEMKHGIEMLATTYGIRKYVTHEKNIFPVALMILSIPFWIFVLALIYDSIFSIKRPSKNKDKVEIDDKKLKEKKNN